MRALRRIGRLGLVLLGCCIGLFIAEIGLRLATGPGEMPVTPLSIVPGRWRAHPFLPYAGVPGGEFELPDTDEHGNDRVEHIRNNAYGFRAHELPVEAAKADTELRVVCLGGSTTYGRRVARNAETWPELLEVMLAGRYPERDVHVYNLGMDRATTAVSVVNMALVATHLAPDLVIVYHGYNDLAALGARDYRTDHAHFYTDFSPERVSYGLQRGLPRALRSSMLVRRLAFEFDRYRGVNDLASEIGKPRMAAEDPLDGIGGVLENLRTIHSLAEGVGAETLFSTFQFRDGDDPTYLRFNAALRGFFARSGFHYVDQAALIPDGDASIHTDVCHFTDLGREILARNFFTAIVKQGLIDAASPADVPSDTPRVE